MANQSKNDKAVYRNLVKSGMLKPALPPLTLSNDKEASRKLAIVSRRKELAKH